MRKDSPVETRPGEAVIWTDGACSGNPGPGGWAAIVIPSDGGDPVELSGGERADDQQPDGADRGARGPALAARRLEGRRGDGLAADAELDDDLAAGLEAQGLEDGGGQAGQEPGPADRARRRGQAARGTCAGTGSAGTRPAPRTRTRRSTTAPTSSPSRPLVRRPDAGACARLSASSGAEPAFARSDSSSRIASDTSATVMPCDGRERISTSSPAPSSPSVDDPQVGARPARLAESSAPSSDRRSASRASRTAAAAGSPRARRSRSATARRSRRR